MYSCVKNKSCEHLKYARVYKYRFAYKSIGMGMAIHCTYQCKYNVFLLLPLYVFLTEYSSYLFNITKLSPKLTIYTVSWWESP